MSRWGNRSYQVLSALPRLRDTFSKRKFSTLRNPSHDIKKREGQLNNEVEYPELLSMREEVLNRELSPFMMEKLELSLAELGLPTVEGNLPNGTPLFPYNHTVYFPNCNKEGTLGKDGYDQIFAPPSPPFTERVISSGILEYNPNNWLKLGQVANMFTTCHNITPGHSERRGESLAVEEKKVYSNSLGHSLTEYRTLTYFHPKPKSATPSTSQPIQKPGQPKPFEFSLRLIPTPALLFRYSALTFNAHRIHFDPEYCRQVENYPDCLVHGPLLVTLALRFLCQLLPLTTPWSSHLTTFSYRLLRPTYVSRPLTLKANLTSDRTLEIWMENELHQLTFRSRAQLSTTPN